VTIRQRRRLSRIGMLVAAGVFTIVIVSVIHRAPRAGGVSSPSTTTTTTVGAQQSVGQAPTSAAPAVPGVSAPAPLQGTSHFTPVTPLTPSQRDAANAAQSGPNGIAFIDPKNSTPYTSEQIATATPIPLGGGVATSNPPAEGSTPSDGNSTTTTTEP
jgi:hypothetical protein